MKNDISEIKKTMLLLDNLRELNKIDGNVWTQALAELFTLNCVFADVHPANFDAILGQIRDNFISNRKKRKSSDSAS